MPNPDPAQQQEKQTQRGWAAKIGFLAATIAAVYGLILGDLWLRARQSYREGEKYLGWHRDPQAKRAGVDREFQDWKAKLDQLFKKKRISQADYQERLELAEFDRNEKIKESSVKYAYIWFQTTAELFSPPDNVWVRRAREKMVETKELWKKELTANKIPFEDYMLE
ncbi:MAG: hypothetical protein HY401_01025 [Elusimicrobia bacterium]|nr:hypothetical protein [Elusimicrobiota bacterium]